MTEPNKRQKHWPSELEVAALQYKVPVDKIGRPQASPISMASVWQMESPELAASIAAQDSEFIYRRDGHPNELELSCKLATLHRAKHAMITAQGMSAIAATAIAVLKPGDSVWVANELYGKTNKLFHVDMPQWGIHAVVFDPCNPDDVSRLHAANARLVIIETMSNPRLRVPDIQTVANATHHAQGLLLVDNTFATPLLCRPLDVGADLVMESLSKIVCGHSDSMLGMLAVNDDNLAKRVRDVMTTFGLASSPLDCYLTHRGLMTLALRLERACLNAQRLAEHLQQSPSVARVDYPGLATHPNHAISQEQFPGSFGWMMAFELKTELVPSQVFASLAPEIAFVPSLGDVCTTLSHPATTSHRSLTAEQLAKLGISFSTIRVSCGIEPTEWLIDRFSKAGL